MEKKQLIVNDSKILGVESKNKISIGLNIRRYTTDANGTIIDDSTVPASMAVSYPFHLFGEFDKQSGFAIADKLLSVKNNTKLFGVYTWGVNTPLFFFNPLANINAKFQKGDIIFIYVDDLTSPNYFSFVQVNSVDGGYASVVSQTMITQLSDKPWGAFKMFEIHYGWVDKSQLEEIFYQVNSKFDLGFNTNYFEPMTFYSPEIVKQKKLVIPFEGVVNQFLGLSSFIAFENSLLTLSIIVYV